MSVIKQIKREAKASPAKAAALGGALLVAAWFWAPLIMEYTSSGDTPPPASSHASNAPTDTPAVAATPQPAAAPTTLIAAPAANDVTAFDWRPHSRAMDRDPLMQSALQLPNNRDPFAGAQPASNALLAAQKRLQAEVEQQTKAALAVKPADVGLVLNSTLVSSRQRVAEINGRSYYIDEQIRGVSEGADATFRLVDVQPRTAVLERNGKRYELKMPRPLIDSATAAATTKSSRAETLHEDEEDD